MSNSNNMYSILNKLNGLEAKAKPSTVESTPKSRLQESMEQVLSEKYMGFKKLEKSIAAKGDVENPAAVAAAIGRKKYGKEKFQKAAAKGKKLGESTVMEDHFKVGDSVKCISSGMTGKVVKLDKPETGKYYHVNREDGKTVKYAPADLELAKSVDEGNEFSGALANAKAAGAKEFKVDGKTYPVKEAKSKPDFLDIDNDGNKKETMKKAAKVAEETGLNKSVEVASKIINKTDPYSTHVGSLGNNHVFFSGSSGSDEHIYHIYNDKTKETDTVSFYHEGKPQSLKDIAAAVYDYSIAKIIYGHHKDNLDESVNPMTAKQKSFAALAEPKDKITFADKIAGAKKEVDEMLGDVAAEAMKAALGKGKQPTMGEATREIPGGRRHTAGPGGYGRKDDEDAPRVQTQRGRGRPKKNADSETGEVMKPDWSAFGVGKVNLPKHKGAVTKHKMVGEEVSDNDREVLERLMDEAFAEGNNALGNALQGVLEMMSDNEDNFLDMYEAVKEVPGGRRHTAEPGGYGRKDDEEAPKPASKRGRGRPKKGSDSETGEVMKPDWSAFGVGKVNLPKHKGAVIKHKMVGESVSNKFNAILEAIDMAEKKMSKSQMARREEIVKGMKKNKAEMMKRYGSRWEDVMYATATKQAMKEGVPGNFTRANHMVDTAFNNITEGMYLNETPTGLDHIVNTYKYEVKQFIDGADMDQDLYDALYDYYLSAGEMPYGIAKARTGDPYEWVADRFYQDAQDYINESNHSFDAMELNPDFKRISAAPSLSDKLKSSFKKAMNVVAPDDDTLLSKLERETGGRRPAQVKESKENLVSECGMSPIAGMAQAAEQDNGQISISTNINSDGTKTVSINAENNAAEQLLQMLKLAGVTAGAASEQDEQAAEPEEVEEEKDPSYAASTTPDETVLPVQSQIEGGDGDVAGQQKEMKPHGYKFSDNPLSMKRADEGVSGLDTMGRKFMREYEGIKIKK